MIARRLLMFRLARRYISRRFLQSALFVIGVALGVAVGVAIDLANLSAKQAFTLSAQTVAGRATHQIIGGPGGLPTELYTHLRTELGIRASAPIVERYVGVRELPGQPMRLLGVDVFAEAPFRDYLTTSTIETEGEDALNALQAFLLQPGSVLLSTTQAQRTGLLPGDTLTLEINGAYRTVQVVGLLNPRDNLSAQALDTLLLADIATAQELLDMPGKLSRIDLLLPPEAETQPIEAILPPGAVLTTPGASNSALNQMTAAFELNLRALSLLALVVGVFLIYNTVAFSIVQRRQDIGIMRSLGTTRRQIFTLIVGEAALLGTVGTVLGLALGIILGRAVVGLIAQTISDLYFAVTVRGVTVAPGTLLTGALIGLSASILAAAIPSFEATRTPPAGTMQRSSTEQRARRIVPIMTGTAVILVSGGILILNLPSSSIVLGFAALFLIVVGSALLTPIALIVGMRLITPLTSRLLGVMGRIAPRDVIRSLSRTAIAVAALTIAVSVIVGVGVMIGSFRITVTDWLGNTLGADIFISPETTGGTRVTADLDRDLIAQIAAVPGIETVTAVRNVTAIAPDYPDLPPANISAVTHDISVERRFVWVEAPTADWWGAVENGAVLVTEPFAFRRGITPENNRITLLTDRGPQTFPIIGVYYDYTTDQGSILMHDRVYRQYFDDPFISSLGLFVAPDADLNSVINTLRQSVLADQGLIVRSNRELRNSALEVFERTFSITTALQLLATIVAFIGILSALMALQLEHAREYAIMRANGMTPAQLWQLTLTQTGLMGAAAGLMAAPIGLALAIVLIEVINVRSFGWSMQIAFTPGEFVQAFAIAVIAALLAGLYPAWRLTRLEVSEGLRLE
ncbi:MAG: FtsX-like permease family protein [Anaerolineae bacterium]